MKRSLANSSAAKARLAVGAALALMLSLTGCESLQRKFTRKRKHPEARPSPIVQFQDYSKAMTSLERYRKHYLIFEYWNVRLMEALTKPLVSAKRVRRSSADALQELQVMRQLLSDKMATGLEPLIEQRTRLDARIQRGALYPGEHTAIYRTLEKQTRRIHREFFWRKIEDQLRGESPDEAPEAAESGPDDVPPATGSGQGDAE